MASFVKNYENFGHFELIQRLDIGHFGQVYEAVDMRNPELRIAIKILKEEFMDRPETPQILERFSREAMATKELEISGLVKTIEHGEIAGRFYIAMKLVPGKSLDKVISEKGCFHWNDAMAIIEKLAYTLDKLHSKGVIHRDLKPSNIILTNNREPTITDLGSAFVTGLASITFTGQTPTTPPYAAPEIWKHPIHVKEAHVTAATDVYALGCIFYEMLTGKRLFDVDSNEAYHAHVVQGAQIPKIWPEAVPKDIGTILAYSVMKEMADRYQTAGNFFQALRGLETGKTIFPKFHHPPKYSIDKHLWFTYTSVTQIRQIVMQEGYLWAATSGGVIGFDTTSRLPSRYYTISQGLPSHEVSCLTFDSRTGRLWAATEKGICNLPSANFYERAQTPFANPPNNKIRSILVTPDGNLWGATETGVYCFSNGKYEFYSEAEGMSGFNAYCLLTGPDQKIWAGTASGVVRFNGKSWNRLPNDISQGCLVHVMKIDKNNVTWLGSSRGLLRYSHGDWRKFGTLDDLPADDILDLALDAHGELWIGTIKGVARMSVSSCEKVNLQTINGAQLEEIQTLAWDTGFGGHLWLGTPVGLFFYDGNLTYPMQNEQGLLDNLVYCSLKDNNNNLWFGSAKGLSHCYSSQGKSRWVSYSSIEKVYGPVKTMVQDSQGVIWIGTNQGLLQYENGNWIHHLAGHGKLPGNTINALLPIGSSQELWVATNLGIGVWDGRRWRQYRRQPGLANEEILSLALDPLGGVWCGTNGDGASYWNGNDWQAVGVADGLRGRVVMGISGRIQDGSLWFATDSGAYCREANGRFLVVALPSYAGLMVRCVLADRKGYIWFGTNQGLVCHLDERYATLFTTRDGLAGNQVLSIWQDAEDCLWLSTNQGVSCLD